MNGDFDLFVLTGKLKELNANISSINAMIEKLEEGNTNVTEKLDNLEDGIASSISGKLGGFISEDGAGARIVKSIQRIVKTLGESGRTEATISPIDASRSIVISERLYDPFGYTAKMVYSLSNDKLIIQPHQGNASYQIIYGFWIVEFY